MEEYGIWNLYGYNQLLEGKPSVLRDSAHIHLPETVSKNARYRNKKHAILQVKVFIRIHHDWVSDVAALGNQTSSLGASIEPT